MVKERLEETGESIHSRILEETLITKKGKIMLRNSMSFSFLFFSFANTFYVP